jgi:hypothetical protein
VELVAATWLLAQQGQYPELDSGHHRY